MKRYPISVIIPVYKNYAMFYKYLNKNKEYLEGCEVIIMNDYPGENITRPVHRIYDKAVLVNNRKNLGFAGNVNKGVMRAKRNFVFLMNSDVVLKDDSFLKALEHFKRNKKLFAVSFAQAEANGKIIGSNAGYFADGMISHRARPADKLSKNFWAEGGAAVFRKKVFTGLGMLDNLFNPFYWEDIDLSYRAWKAGYQVLYDPQIVVEHHHESTIGKYFDNTVVLKTAFRNQLIFQWKNIADRDLMSKHLMALSRLLISSLIRRNQIVLTGFFRALSMLPAILKSRKKALKLFIKSDVQVLSIFEK